MKTILVVCVAAGFLGLGVVGCSETIDTTGSSGQGGSIIAPQEVTNPCGESTVTELLGGQFIGVGNVAVANDGLGLDVTYTTTGGWVIVETHLAVASTLEEIPQTGSENPKVGKFLLSAEHDPPVTEYTHSIDLTESIYGYLPGDELFVAAHAVVQLLDESGAVVQEETAWADGFGFEGNNWAMYFNHVVQDCNMPESGACCYEDGFCAVLTLSDCNEEGGSYMGTGTPCDPGLCGGPE